MSASPQFNIPSPTSLSSSNLSLNRAFTLLRCIIFLSFLTPHPEQLAQLCLHRPL